MASSGEGFWFTQLDAEAARRCDQRSFHAFAEGMHSDVRGQVLTLNAGDSHLLPDDRWPKHVFVILGLSGTVDATLAGRDFVLRTLSQLVVLPGVPCELRARSDAAVELISFLSTPPTGPGPG